MPIETPSKVFQELVEQHRGILFKVAKAYCPHEEEQQDLVQDMMIQIWQSMHRYDPQYKISTWVYRIALNVAISHYRKNMHRQRKQATISAQVKSTPDLEASEKEHQLKLLEQFINELKELDKALMVLYLEDRSHAEIAEIIGISVSNVATKIGRIKDKLKQRFSQQKIIQNGR